MKLPRHAQVPISQSLARNAARRAPRPPCGKTTTRVAFFLHRSPNATAGQECPPDAQHRRPRAEISRGRLTPVLRLRLSGCCSSGHMCRKRRYFSHLPPYTTIGTQPAIEISHPRLLWVASVSYLPASLYKARPSPGLVAFSARAANLLPCRVAFFDEGGQAFFRR